MRTKTITLYSFSELSEEAQQHAIEKFREFNTEHLHGDEIQASLDAFANVFPVNVRRAYYGDRGEGVEFWMTCKDEIEELSGPRLATYIWNNYRDDLFKGKWYSTSWDEKNRILHASPDKKSLDRRSKIILEHSCVLTGVCFDEDILEPVYKFLDKPDPNKNFRDLMEDCFHAWIKTGNDTLDYQLSDEYAKEMIEANEYEFDEDGNIQ